MNLAADLLRGYTDSIILAQLQSGESYGYRINQAVSALSGRAFEMKEATLYTAFRRLEAAGLITSRWGDEETGARRRYYRLTEQGKARLREDQAGWKETRQLLDLLLKEGTP